MRTGTRRALISTTAAAAAAASEWWLEGGVAEAECVAAYAAKGAASQAASYVNLANPGTYDLTVGSAPAWDTGSGWDFNGSSHYLLTGVAPTWGYTMIVKLSSFDANNFGIPVGTGTFFLQNWDGTTFRYSLVNAPFQTLGYAASGVFAIAGGGYAAGIGYRDGVQDVTGMGNGGEPTYVEFYIGANNNAGSPANYSGAVVQAVAIYNTQLSQAEIDAIGDAMP